MTKIVEVKTSVGVWVVKKPKAGARNKALKAAESDSGVFKKTVLMGELLPKCIQERPDGFDKTVPIEQVLDDLELEDYDALVIALSELITTPADVAALDKAGEEKKTSSTPSLSQADSQSQKSTE